MRARRLAAENWSGAATVGHGAAQAQGGAMTESRVKRLGRTVGQRKSGPRVAAVPPVESRWTLEARPLLPPLKVGREWDRIRRIAYL